MSNTNKNPYKDFVFNLPENEFKNLDEAISMRKNFEKYGATDFEELAIKLKREPICPKCGSKFYVKHSHTPNSKQRYQCKECGHRYNLMSNSIFNSTNKSFDTWITYLTLMTFNVPLEMTEELCDISHPTAMLWRKKVFSTINDYQDRIILKGTVWIDETYTFDSSILHDNDFTSKRGLSKNQLCIVVAIDIFENTYAVICGHGKPTKKRIYNALKDHIEDNALLIHDGEKAHNELIEKLHLRSEVYKADSKSNDYLLHMALINNLCSWIKRYIYRFVGMRKENLQSYLNWFVYLLRVKNSTNKWPKLERILRHLILNEGTFTR